MISWRGEEEEEEGDGGRCLCKRDETRARQREPRRLRRGPHRASVVGAIAAAAAAVTSSADAEGEEEASERSLRPTEWLCFIDFFFLVSSVEVRKKK